TSFRVLVHSTTIIYISYPNIRRSIISQSTWVGLNTSISNLIFHIQIGTGFQYSPVEVKTAITHLFAKSGTIVCISTYFISILGEYIKYLLLGKVRVKRKN